MDDIKKNLKEDVGGGILFGFNKMITPLLIKVFYNIGIIITTVIGIGKIISGLDAYYDGEITIFMGLLILILGPIIIRVNCELLIVIFKIHEALEEIRRK